MSREGRIDGMQENVVESFPELLGGREVESLSEGFLHRNNCQKSF